MLKVCTHREYKTYADYVYSLATDPSKSGYPTYSDGIKTKEMFLARAEKAFTRETENILLFEFEGTVEGWIHYYYLPEDQYLSTVSFNIESHTEQALEEFIDFARHQFRGYELYLGYSADNQSAVDYLSSHGFECIEENYNNTAFLHRYAPIAADGHVVRITKHNYQSFRTLHSAVEGDMYWNSDRIYADLEDWIIFVHLRDGEPLGSVYYVTDDDGWYEVFGIDMKDNVFDTEIFRALLVTALNTAKELGGKYMTFFCGDEAQSIVRELGFDCVGKYVCYQTLLED